MISSKPPTIQVDQMSLVTFKYHEKKAIFGSISSNNNTGRFNVIDDIEISSKNGNLGIDIIKYHRTPIQTPNLLKQNASHNANSILPMINFSAHVNVISDIGALSKNEKKFKSCASLWRCQMLARALAPAKNACMQSRVKYPRKTNFADS